MFSDETFRRVQQVHEPSGQLAYDLARGNTETRSGVSKRRGRQSQQARPETRLKKKAEAADESFVRFDFSAGATELVTLGLHTKANSVQHKPCRLLGNSQGAVNLPRRNTVLAVSNHPHRLDWMKDIETGKVIYSEVEGRSQGER